MAERANRMRLKEGDLVQHKDGRYGIALCPDKAIPGIWHVFLGDGLVEALPWTEFTLVRMKSGAPENFGAIIDGRFWVIKQQVRHA